MILKYLKKYLKKNFNKKHLALFKNVFFRTFLEWQNKYKTENAFLFIFPKN
jgi:hypothetical protein